MIGPIRRFRRWKISRRPFPQEWRGYLSEHFACYRMMPPEWRNRYEHMIRIFIAERHWIPAAGMVIDDRVKVIIAGAAVRLVLRLGLEYYDRMREIVVYPYVYKHKDERGMMIFGEAHPWGTVVLSWPAVLHGLANPCDGENTALHEFAHILDRDDGAFNGTPFLHSREDYGPWAEVMARHFELLKLGGPEELAVLRMYGATNPAEFFSVATEAFFEIPSVMQGQMPELYEVMKKFYGGDPFTYGLCPRRL
ncbi:MAG TPA: zinc-dependent peptidase [Myxococcota bacterium]|nr:zinc-dependent peptidase [Myxococcota bacterium]HOC99144.1 zinc-dependent peptidase [Myxococcota bacterium]